MKYEIAVYPLIFLLFPLNNIAQDNLMSRQIGAVKEVRRADHVIHFVTVDNEDVQIRLLDPAVLRVTVVTSGMPISQSYAVVQNDLLDFNKMINTEKETTLFTDSLKIVVQKDPLRIDFYNSKGQWLDGDAPFSGISRQGEEITSYRRLTDEEKFIGLGEKTGPLNRRELSYVNWNTDAPGYGLTDDPLYSTLPFFIGIHSDRVFGIFFDNSYKSFFNFGGSTDGSSYFFGAEGGAMNYYFFGASSVSGLIRDYTWLTGRMEMPPLWSLGYQQSRWSYTSQQQVLDIAGRMRQDSIPCDVIYCDIDYMNGYRVFTWNPVTYSHPKFLTDSLKRMGIHLVTIIDPGVKIDTNGYQPYISGLKNHFFLHYPDGRPYTGSVWAGRSHFPDFTRDTVRKWWGENFRILTGNGVTGFWNDMNEPSVWGQDIPPLVESGEGKNTVTLKQSRNIYGMQMARATFEGTRSLLKGERPFVLTRAAYSGIQRYSAMWTGDNNPTDDHMLLGYRMINSMGLAGVAFDGVDIGGFTGNPTPELMVRWMSLGVYTPMFRNHTARDNTSHEPWAWGEDNEKLMRQFIRTRYRLLPYLYSVFHEATLTGMPVNRTLAIDYTFDNAVYDTSFENEFLFGPFMLIAPVASICNSVQVYLPSGEWYRFGSDEKYGGNRLIRAGAPLNDLPVFVKAGAIIPMQNPILTTAYNGDGIMYLNIWYGDIPGRFNYYEDDGITYQYTGGKYYERVLSFNPGDREISLDSMRGGYNTRFRTVELILHGFPAGSKYKVNGQYEKTAGKGIVQTLSFPLENGKISVKW
jgi:alpha-glucosidase